MRFLLHVEDDIDDSSVIEELWMKHQNTVSYKGFETADLALKFLNNTFDLPCVILTDLNLPGMNGKEFMRRVKEIKRLEHIPIVGISTSSIEEEKKYCLNYCDAFFVKPLDLEGFRPILDKVWGFCGLKSRIRPSLRAVGS